MSKKSKLPFALRSIQWLFPKVEAVSPVLAARWFQHLFFTPIRYKSPEKELEIARSAQQYKLLVGEKNIQIYTWGEGVSVLMIHGWAGRGTQFRKFVEPFTAQGFKVVAIDGPAHGKSDGSKTEIMEFARVIESVYNKEQAVAIIAHSFGGVASLYAMANGLQNKVQINIASPTIGEEIIKSFLKALKASERIGKLFRDFILKQTGKRFEEFSALEIVKQIPHEFDLMLVYDEDDDEVTMEHAHAIKKVYPQANLFQTKGLGHNRILKEDRVINRCVTFIQQKTSIQQ
ncbi:alpha/beta hydrolase [Chryseotalea sanaruensis]|uniref:Alpha/beta hydrolase n=1 Tax=Chryseotalea sanaruensis TaxID=2482724 RepID=A0A401U5H6_9BACT|nr:alpha/beta hydrolase family protein [Chryseotalea sanaruensis]GCC50132.1 alpha/beta hydrolase [Chryseotalea sanaruensis]